MKNLDLKVGRKRRNLELCGLKKGIKCEELMKKV